MFKDFAEENNPQTQVNFAKDVRDTIEGDYSTLEELDQSKGMNTSAMWLTVAITDINEFCGSKSMNDPQIKSLAYVIAEEYKNVKFSIMQLFFYRFKCGYFGKFYGKVDPMVITCALKDFIEECKQKHQEYYNEDYEEKKAEEDRERSRRLSFESLWYDCQRELVKESPMPLAEELFRRINFVSYDEETKTLLLAVTREDYQTIEDVFLDFFADIVFKYFPQAKIQYKVKTPQPTAGESTLHQSIQEAKRREIEGGLESARKIISNTLHFSQEVIENMAYSFKLRYKLTPQEFIDKYSPSK